MASPERRVYFDTTVYVAALIGPDEPDHAVSLAAIEHAQSGGVIGVASGLVEAEVLGAPKVRAAEFVGGVERARRIAKAQAFFDRLAFEFVDLTRKAGREAARIASDRHLKGADAAHVAMALLAGCTELQTLDGDQLKLHDSLGALVVCRPQSPLEAPGSLFANDGNPEPGREI